MVKNNVKNRDRHWQNFEESGSIDAFLEYYDAKQPKADKSPDKPGAEADRQKNAEK